MMFALKQSSPNYIPIKYKNPNKKTSHLRATSHMRLRARDQFNLSTLIGGKDGAGPSSPHTTLEGPTEYVNARWMSKSTWIPTWHPMDHVSQSLGLFSKTTCWR